MGSFWKWRWHGCFRDRGNFQMSQPEWPQPAWQHHLRNGEQIITLIVSQHNFNHFFCVQPSDYDPLSVNMGSLTVYRFTLRCKCDRSALQTDSKTGKLQKCGQFMPFDQQGWPSYAGMLSIQFFKAIIEQVITVLYLFVVGIKGDSYFNYKARMKQRMEPKKKGG